MNDGVAVQDQSGTIIHVNNRICEMLARSRQEVIGHALTDFCDMANAIVFKNKMAMLHTGDQVSEIMWTAPDGGKIHTLVSLKQIFDSEAKFRRALQ